MQKCHHCGETDRNTTLCFNCSNFFCELHKDPVIHECKINTEYQNLQNKFEEKREALENQEYHWYHSENAINQQHTSNKETETKKPEKLIGSSVILAVVLFFSGISFIFSPLFRFNIYWLLNFNQWTFLTALFVVRLDGVLDLILLVLNLIFIFRVMIDIENRYRSIFLLKLFFLSSIFSGCFFILARLVLSIIIPIGYIDLYFFSTGFGWAGLLGIVSFKFFLEPETQWDVYFCYIPVKMEGKSVLVILILLRLIPNLVIIITNELYMLVYCCEFFGLIVGCLIYYRRSKKA